MKILNLLIVLSMGAVLFYGSLDFPDFGDADSPANSYLSPEYIQRTMKDAHTPNIVTSVLADYRGYDTMGETTVVFTAGAACILLLRKVLKKRGN